MEISISDGGIDWPAWVQAVGSVLAIIAAILIDQGTARRERQARRETVIASVAARRRVMQNCAEALEVAAGAFDECEFSVRAHYNAGPEPLRRLENAQLAIRHFVARGSDDDALLVVTLSNISNRLDDAVVRVRESRIRTAEERDEFRAEILAAARGIREFIKDYDAGKW